MPLQSGTLVGIAFADGREAWRTTLEQGLRTRAMIASGKRLLAALSDERQFTEAEHGLLVAISPASGKLTTLWEAETPLLSLPIMKEDMLFLRTSKPELIALRLGTKVEVQWRAGLNSSGAMLPPCVSGGYAFVSDGEVMHGKSFIAAYELETGRLAGAQPTDGMLSQPMAASADVLIFQDGRKRLAGLDAASLEIIWKKDYERIYTPPTVQEGIVYVVVRGGTSKGESGYYSLHAINPRSGEIEWQAALPARVLIPPTVAESRIYLGSEEGRIFCLDAQGGGLLWDYTLGSDEDPLRTELLFTEGLLLAGTYSGKVAAIHIAEPAVDLEDPKAYLEREEFEPASAAYALKGEFRKAARVYAEKLQDYLKALALYEHASLYKEAAELARSQGMLSEAEQLFGMAGDLKNQAEVLHQRGDILGAARLFEQAGDLGQAAKLYEESGDRSKARDLYRQTNQVSAFIRLLEKGPVSSDTIDYLVEQKKPLEAAEAALNGGFLRRAIDIFHTENMEDRELEALLKFTDQEPEEWALERVAELARKKGSFSQEAFAWERLKKPRKAADAYCRAAKQAEQTRAGEAEWIASLYEKAAHFFDDVDLLEMEQQCREKVARYRRLPVVRIDGQTEKEFKELEWNKLELTISNEGFGIAADVHWRVSTDRFEIAADTGEWAMRRLGAGNQKTIRFSFRPKKGEIGAVPFSLEWFWKSESGEEFRDNIVASVPVKGKDDSRPTGQPVIFQGGTLIQTEKYVVGDELAPGAQKGDKVEIHRGGGVKLTAGQDAVEIKPGRKSAELPCPTCHLSNEADAKVCNYCGNELPALQTSKRKK